MKLVALEAKRINGLVTRTDNSREMSADQGQIPALWQRFDDSVAVDYQQGERVYGVYFNYESDHTGEFDVLAGYDGAGDRAPIELEQIEIPAGNYLVFAQQGQMPQIAIDAWTQVWDYFTGAEAQYERLFNVDFEYYPNGNQIEIYIAVK